jgi:O-antigen ligase
MDSSMDTVINKQYAAISDKWAHIFLPLTLLTLPVSSSAKSLFLILSLIAILLVPKYRQDIMRMMSAPYVKAAFCLFGLVVLGCFWSHANIHQKVFELEKYSKYLYLPILIIGFQQKSTRDMALKGFLFAMCFVCILSTVKHLGFLQAYAFDPNFIFRNHIITGIMVSFAAYLSALFCYRATSYKKLNYAPIILLLSYQLLFVNSGRTGYVFFFLLCLIFLVQTCNWKKTCLGFMALIVFFSAAYLNSPVIQTRVSDSVSQLKDYQQDKKDTEIGLRLQFHHYAYDLFKRHPVVGNGTGGFTYAFSKDNPVPFWMDLKGKLLEPHSQYWFIASEFGMLGLTVLCLFFAALVHASRQLKQMKPIAFALIITFLIGNLSDSLLFYSGSGYFFLLMIALCLGELVETK